MRASPLSSDAMAASTAWRTSPFVVAPIASRSSQARSITDCRSLAILVPQDAFQPLADVRHPNVDDGFVITVAAPLRPIVDPDGRHAELLRRREIADHVLHHNRSVGLDTELI